MAKSRRSRIIELLGHGYSDEAIIPILDSESPPGTFLTSNSKALYGTKWDLGKTECQVKRSNANIETK